MTCLIHLPNKLNTIKFRATSSLNVLGSHNNNKKLDLYNDESYWVFIIQSTQIQQVMF